jgi:hypothetical protein
MKFNSPSLNEKKSEYFLGLDIGSEAVKSIIFQRAFSEKDNLKKVIIWGKGLEYFDKSDVFNTQDFEKNTIKNTISESIKGAYQNFLQNIGRKTGIQINSLLTLVSLPPNILKEKVLTQSLTRENRDRIISKKEDADIYQLFFKEIKNEIEKDFSQKFGILPEDIKFISVTISEIKIDGYNVSNLEGFKGGKLEFKTIVVFSLKEYLKNIEIILKDLKINFLKFLDKEQNIPYLFDYEVNDAIFLDVGGEVSQFFLVKKGKTETTFEFENGGLDFTDKLSKVLGLNLEDARNLKHNYSNLILSEDVRKKVSEILTEEVGNWFSNFKKALGIILGKQKILFPSRIFIFGGGSSLPEIQQVLEEGNWEGLTFISKPEVKIINPKDLKNVDDQTRGLISTQDIGLIISCLSPYKENSFIFEK